MRQRDRRRKIEKRETDKTEEQTHTHREIQMRHRNTKRCIDGDREAKKEKLK